MPEEATFRCIRCRADKPRSAFSPSRGLLRGHISTCKTCRNEQRRGHYYASPRTRALQLARTAEQHVKRRFPEAHTGLRAEAYADLLLGAQACDYCGHPNDGTHAFNLDHRGALGVGGRHDLANLVPCCEPCNRAKRDMPEGVYRAWLAGVVDRLRVG